MTKLTPQELDERIGAICFEDQYDDVRQLIRDCIEAVTPEKSLEWYSHIESHNKQTGYNKAIDTIQANTKELLGNTKTEGNT